MKLIKIFSALIVSVLFLTSCTQVEQSPTAIPAPDDGNANVTGTILTTANKPYQELNVRLAEVYWQNGQGAYVLDEAFSPGAVTDDNGRFVIQNVPAGDYVLVIGKPMEDYKAVTDKDGNLKRVTLQSGDVIDLGNIVFDY